MESNGEGVDKLKIDIKIIKDKIEECRKKHYKIFDTEMTIMTELPEQYDNYPWLIKMFSKCKDHEYDSFITYLNKMVSSLESVVKGDSTLAAVEMKLGQELFDKYVSDKVKNLEPKKE
jgi:lantibiotic modifying enzyme